MRSHQLLLVLLGVHVASGLNKPAAFYDECVKWTNAMRAREGLPAMGRWTRGEACLDSMAAFDASKNWALDKLRISAAQHCMLPFMFADMDEVDEIFGGDPWPYGLVANRPTLEALVQHLHEQYLIAKTVPIEKLFVSVE